MRSNSKGSPVAIIRSQPLSLVSVQSPQRALDPEPILTREQVAERLQLEPSTVYELTRRRNKRPLPAMKAGKVLRFYWSDVERWLKGEDVA
jgi:excisionase family DNA binding protein